MSEIQAVIFKKRYWDSKKARNWLSKNKIKPIKPVHKTLNYLRYRIRNPKIFKRFFMKEISPSIKLVIGVRN